MNVRGFSLIELSVVLLLVSLATAMVLPNLAGTYSSIQARSEFDQALLKLSSLGYLAYSKGESLIIEQEVTARSILNLDDGWQVDVVDPISVNAHGVCLGGTLRLVRGTYERLVRLVPPYCFLEDSE